MRLLVSGFVVSAASTAAAGVASVPSVNRNTLLDLLLFLAPGFVAIKLFQWVWNLLIRRDERTRFRTVKLELVQIGTLIFALVLSLLGGWLASAVAGRLWPDRGLFSYLREVPAIDGAMFLGLAVHTAVSLGLGALAAVVLHLVDRRCGLMPQPKKSPWAQLWEDTYDKRRHVVTVRIDGVSYFGKLKYVDTSGAHRDIILEEPKQYFDETGETVQEGEVLLIRDVQQHQLLLIDLYEEEGLVAREGVAAEGEPTAAAPGDVEAGEGAPYSEEGGGA